MSGVGPDAAAPRHPAVTAAAGGSTLTTLLYLVILFPVSLGVAGVLEVTSPVHAGEAFLQGLLLGYAVAFVWFLWLVCLVVAAIVGFPLAILIERRLRATGAERWRPLAMGALGGAIGTVIVVVALLTETVGTEFDSVWPWVVVAIPGAIASAVGHWLASVLRARSTARRREAADDDTDA